MKQWAMKHWIAAFFVALFGHAALAISLQSTTKPEIERSAGTPIEIVGSLTSFAQTITAEEVPEEVVEEKTTTKVTEKVLEPVTETKVEPLTATKQEVAKLEESAILPVAEPEKIKPEPPKKPKVKKKKPVKKVKKKKRKPSTSGKRLAALKKGGGAKGRQNKIAGSASLSNYRGRVQSHLARYKKSPGRGVRGRAIVSFSITKSGRVSSVRLARRSGNSAIDRAALSMVRRASPFPPIPNGMRSRMSFSVPVNYR